MVLVKLTSANNIARGNRIYDADAIAVCLTAQPLGNMGGYSSLYVVRRKKSKKDGERINEK